MVTLEWPLYTVGLTVQACSAGEQSRFLYNVVSGSFSFLLAND